MIFEIKKPGIVLSLQHAECSPDSKDPSAGFVLGRKAAKEALSALGYSGTAEVVKGASGEPLWPEGYAGSITHTISRKNTQNFLWAAAIVGQQNQYASIGIDIECKDRVQHNGSEPNLAPILNKICGQEELQTWSSRCADSAELKRTTLTVFSAKESIYKAYFPLVKKYFGFTDALVLPTNDARLLSAQILKDFGEQMVYPKSCSVEVITHPDLIITLVALQFPITAELA